MRYFTDRIVQRPGRVTLTPVSGQANTYDMSRAEGTITTPGTPFNADTFNGIVNAVHGYATCTTGASTAAKVATCEGFQLYTGACVTVRFSYTNSSTTATLNVNSTGAKPIRALNGDSAAPTYMWAAGEAVTFVYNGTNWLMVSGGKGTKTSWGKARELITDAERSTLQTALGTANSDLATILNKIVDNQVRKNVSPSISTSVGTLNGAYANRVGKVVMLSVTVINNSSVATGSNIYEGTLNTTAIRPYTTATGASYVGQRAIGAQVTSSGSIIVRNSSTTALTLTNSINVSFTYIVE